MSNQTPVTQQPGIHTPDGSFPTVAEADAARIKRLKVEQSDRNDKIRRFKTAKATISCAHFAAGEYVSVEYSNTTNGVNWFLIRKTEKKTLENPVAYPQHHLTQFCL